MDSFTWIGQLLGGLGLFLYGLEVFSNQMRANAGESMRRILTRMTATPWHGLLAGLSLTAIIQSSSVVTALTVGLVEAGMISFSQSLAVIMGTNIGTTITMQLMAFKITDAASWLVFIGAFALIFWRWQRRYIAELILALGIIFLGLNIMSDAMKPLQHAPWMHELIAWIDTPWSAALVGAIVTAIIQSSSAFGGIALALLLQGQIDLTTGVALMLGANIGTCVTVLLAAIGKSRESIKVAVFHLLFNLLGAITTLILLDPFLALLTWISSGLSPEQTLANGHALFNICVAIILIAFVHQIVQFINLIIPNKDSDLTIATPLSIASPASASEGLSEGWRIIHAMIDTIEGLRGQAIRMPQSSAMKIDLQPLTSDLQQLDQRLLALMSLTGQCELSSSQEQQILQLTRFSNRLRSIGYLLGISIPNAYNAMLQEDLMMSAETQLLYETLQHRVGEQLSALLLALTKRETVNRELLQDNKKEMRQLREALEIHHSKRLSANEPNRVGLYVYELMILDNWMQVSYLTRRLAGLIKPLHHAPEQQLVLI